jgi:RHS repeat-associated protein
MWPKRKRRRSATPVLDRVQPLRKNSHLGLGPGTHTLQPARPLLTRRRHWRNRRRVRRRASGRSVYNYFRDYAPSLGRYVQSDPIGLEGGLNTYSYANGNPLRYIDPDGLQIVMHRLPPRVQEHNRWNDSWRQVRREFQQEPPQFPLKRKPACTIVCTEFENVCMQPPKYGLSVPGRPGCYTVCTDGPAFEAVSSAWSPVPQAADDPRQRGATKNDWFYLLNLILTPRR